MLLALVISVVPCKKKQKKLCTQNSKYGVVVCQNIGREYQVQYNSNVITKGGRITVIDSTNRNSTRLWMTNNNSIRIRTHHHHSVYSDTNTAQLSFSVFTLLVGRWEGHLTPKTSCLANFQRFSIEGLSAFKNYSSNLWKNSPNNWKQQQQLHYIKLWNVEGCAKKVIQ